MRRHDLVLSLAHKTTRASHLSYGMLASLALPPSDPRVENGGQLPGSHFRILGLLIANIDR